MDIKIKLEDQQVQAALNRLLYAGTDMSPLMRVVAGHLADGAEQAFEDEQEPGGEKWEALSEEHIKRRGKSGHVPIQILQMDGALKRSIVPEWTHSTAEAKTGLEYAATHQFGDERRNISARPFFGLSQETEKLIVDDTFSFIAKKIKGS